MPEAPEDRAWERITDAIDTKFGIIKHGRTSRPVFDAQNLTERVSYITFDRNGEAYKLERVAGPAIIDRKAIGGYRVGSELRQQNVYDADEISFRTNVYRQEAGEWVSINPDELGL